MTRATSLGFGRYRAVLSLPGHQAVAGGRVHRAPARRDALARHRPARKRADRLLCDSWRGFGDPGTGIRRFQPLPRPPDRPPRADTRARQLRDRVPDLCRRPHHGGRSATRPAPADRLRDSVRDLLPSTVRGAARAAGTARGARRPDRVGVRARSRDAGAVLHLRTPARRSTCRGCLATGCARGRRGPDVGGHAGVRGDARLA